MTGKPLVGRVPALMFSVVVYWLPVIGWMGVIFALSDRSDLTLSRVLPVFASWHHEKGLDLADLILRKMAHVTEYLVLTVLVFRALWRGRGATPARSLFGIAGLYSVVYAFTDEFHQRFVPGRSGNLRDVVIDTAGVLLALVILRARLTGNGRSSSSGRTG